MKIILAVGALSFSLSTCGRSAKQETVHEHLHPHTHVHEHAHEDGTVHSHPHDHWHAHEHRHGSIEHTHADFEGGADHHSTP